ncbi:MAG: hypothetical protein HC872_02045 [Gammaproteobacteria bacterium]|nr:hypothetical protein [Gammaproteobacteria bacterium]
MDGIRNALLVLIAWACSAAAAHAGVIYRWVNVSTDPEAGPIDAFIEFGNDFYMPGRRLQAAPRDGNPDTLDAYFGIDSLFFGLREQDYDSINLRTNRTCGQIIPGPGNICPPDFTPDTRVVDLGILANYAFDLTLGERLSGSIFINDGSSDFLATSVDSLFTLVNLRSDFGLCSGPRCAGGTGFFQLDASTLPVNVPEPAVWSLLLAGGLMLLRGRASGVAGSAPEK